MRFRLRASSWLVFRPGWNLTGKQAHAFSHRQIWRRVSHDSGARLINYHPSDEVLLQLVCCVASTSGYACFFVCWSTPQGFPKMTTSDSSN